MSSASTIADAATRPVTGSAIASAQNTGPSSSHTASPPAIAASSPKATQSRAGPERPWPVIDAHTLGPPVVRSVTASIPICSRARGREASMTTSAEARRSPSARTPARDRRSRATLRFRPFRRSKTASGPARAPSGRVVDSTLMTSAPASASSAPQSGPAHKELRSSTRTSLIARRAVDAPPTRVARTGAARVSSASGQERRGQTDQPGSLDQLRSIPSPDGLTDHLPRIVDRWQLQPRRHQLQVLGPRQRHGHPPVPAGQQPGRPAAARRSVAGQARAGGALAEKGERIDVERPAQGRHHPSEIRRDPAQLRDEVGRRPERGPVRPTRERHRAAGRPRRHLRGRVGGRVGHGATMAPADARRPLLMPTHHPSLGALRAAARQPAGAASWSSGPGDVALVDLDAAPLPDGVVPRLHSGVPGIVVGLTTAGWRRPTPRRRSATSYWGPTTPRSTAVLATVEANPLAATALTALLARRATDGR